MYNLLDVGVHVCVYPSCITAQVYKGQAPLDKFQPSYFHTISAQECVTDFQCAQEKFHFCEVVWLLNCPLVIWGCTLADNVSIAGTYHTKGIWQRHFGASNLARRLSQQILFWEIWKTFPQSWQNKPSGGVGKVLSAALKATVTWH